MTTRAHVHEEILPATPERVFRLLHTARDIRAWWSASEVVVLPEVGGAWAALWGDEDAPDYVTTAIIKAFEPPHRIVLADYHYRASSGPLPFTADFVTEFLVAPHPDGATLRVTQAGFPRDSSADAFYTACEMGWSDTFGAIRRHLHEETRER